MEPSEDRRIRKTKAAVHTAMLQLMQEKKLSKISVLELTKKADINRKTFYNHYSDIYAVLDEVENECVEHLLSLVETEDAEVYVKTPKLFFERLIGELAENKNYYMLLMQSDVVSHLSQKLIRREKTMLQKFVETEHLDEVFVDYFLIFVSAGMTSVVNHWYMSDHKVDEKKLASFFDYLFSSMDTEKLVALVHTGTD